MFALIDFGAKHMPCRKHTEDAGMDIYAPYDFQVLPHCMENIPLGFGTVMPKGYQAEIRPRGSMGLIGLYPIDNPIDSNYRGEIHAVVWNLSNETIRIKEGERFCQLVTNACVLDEVNTIPQWLVIKPEEAPESDRGANGYGSTGR